MMKTVIVASLAGLIGVVPPAAASDRVGLPSTISTTATVSAQPPAVVTPAGQLKRYCIEETMTGSRLPRRICRTRDQWLAQGFDPLEKR